MIHGDGQDVDAFADMIIVNYEVLDRHLNWIAEMGFKGMQAISLKPKHVTALLERWKAESLAVGTIKVRMSVLRWWAEKVDR